MDKELLIRYFENQTTDEENAWVVDWFNNSEENKIEFASLKNVWSLTNFVSDTELLIGQNESRHVKPSRIIVARTVMRYAAVVIVAVLSTLSVLHYGNKLVGTEQMSNDKQAIAYNEIVVPRGQQAHLTLSDGTKIWLNSKSKLIYPSDFKGESRTVSLDGEAYFEVTKDIGRPFIVETTSVNIKVLGTSFNLSAYRDDVVCSVGLDEGLVSVLSKSSQELAQIRPGELMVYDKNLRMAKVTAADISFLSSWKNGEIRFNRMSFFELSKILERNYNVEFIFKNPKLKEMTFNGVFYEYESIDSILKVLEVNSNFSFKRVHEKVYIE